MKRRTVFLSVVLTCAMIFSSAIGINAENFDKNAMPVTSYKLARQGGSYIYINYNSASGATLRAQQTVEGNEGEYLDVYDYVIDISGMEVDRIEPSAHVMFDKNKRGRVSIIYKNVTKQDNRNEPKDNPDYPRYDPKDNPDYPRDDPKDNPNYPRDDPKDNPNYTRDDPKDNPNYTRDDPKDNPAYSRDDPKDNPDSPNNDPQVGDCYIYINYESDAGHKILAQKLIKGYQGETLDLNDYMEDITTMKFVRFKPSRTLTFNKNKRVNGTLIYTKVTKPVENPTDNPDYPKNDPKDNPKDNPDHPNSNPQGGDCYIYVNYKSDAGHKILAQKLIKGYQGETLDLNDYMEDITTMKFVKFEPSRTLTFDKNEKGNGTLIYTKVTKPVENPTDNKAANEPVDTDNSDNNFVLQNTIDTAKRSSFAYISGVGNGMMNPNAPITRAEAAVMLYNIMSPEYKKIAETSVQKRIAEAENIYSGYNSDVGFDMWYSNAVNAVSAVYIIPSRMTSMFSPDEYMTRADVAYALAKFADDTSASGATIFTDLGTEADSSADAINKVAALGWINGYEDGTFKPLKNVTRAEFTVMVNAMLGRTGTYSYSAGDKTFNDVNDNAWYYNAVMLAVNG